MSKVDVRLQDNVSPALKRLSKFFKGDKQLMNEIGLYQTVRIKTRTLSGKDIYENDFKPYANSTKEIRQAAGRSVNKVTLFFSGKMLGSLAHQVKDSLSVRLYFASLIETEKARENQLARPFFGISDDDEKGIIDIYENKLNKILQGG